MSLTKKAKDELRGTLEELNGLTRPWRPPRLEGRVLDNSLAMRLLKERHHHRDPAIPGSLSSIAAPTYVPKLSSGVFFRMSAVRLLQIASGAGLRPVQSSAKTADDVTSWWSDAYSCYSSKKPLPNLGLDVVFLSRIFEPLETFVEVDKVDQEA